jgi:membrane-associated protease RseP (regulator of RpoE activity)
VDDRADEPVEGAQVVLVQGDHERAQSRTNSEGHFEFELVTAGNYTVIASHDRLLSSMVETRIRPGRDRDLGELRLASGGSVTGEVLDGRGQPVSGAEVTTDGRWAQAVRTDPQGRFDLGSLPAGRVIVQARHPAAGRGEVEVRIRVREETPGARLRLDGRVDETPEDLGPGQRVGVAIAVENAGTEVRVSAVVPGSRAARAGLRPGDVILSIDEEPVAAAAQARSLLRGPAGIEAILEIRRGRRTRRMAVAREPHRPPR